MKIIKQGVAPKDRVYRNTCFSCQTKIEYQRGDPEVTYRCDNRDGDFLEVLCPTCGNTLTQGVNTYEKDHTTY